MRTLTPAGCRLDLWRCRLSGASVDRQRYPSNVRLRPPQLRRLRGTCWPAPRSASKRVGGSRRSRSGRSSSTASTGSPSSRSAPRHRSPRPPSTGTSAPRKASSSATRTGFLRIAQEIGESVDPELPNVEQVRYIVRRCAEFFEAQSEIRAVRDEIVLANPGLAPAHVRHRAQVREHPRRSALPAVRREPEPSTGTLVDAALCMVVVRLALIAWRYEGDASLRTLTDDTFETLRSPSGLADCQ